jgi:hypothetical protein
MHPKHCEQDATRTVEAESSGWQSQCAKEAWSASQLGKNASKQDKNIEFIDFSLPDQSSVFSLPEPKISDMSKSGAGSSSNHKEASAAMHRLVEASLGSDGHQGAADYVRNTEHHGTMGYCAGGVEEAMRRAKLGNFHADAHNLDQLLAKSPLWQEVHIPSSRIKSLPPGYVVVMENQAGKQHAFISDGQGMESSDWHGSMSQDQLLPLVLRGQAHCRVFRPAGDLSGPIPDLVPERPPPHHFANSSGDGRHQQQSSEKSWTSTSFPDFGGPDFGGSSSGDSNSYCFQSSESAWIDPNGTPDTNGPVETPETKTGSRTIADHSAPNLPIGAPDSYFMTQFRSKWNPDGRLRSEDCGPASLAMFMLHAHKFPPGAQPKNRAQFIQTVRRAMTGRNMQEGTDEAEVRKGAAAAGIRSHNINGMAGLNDALAKGQMVVARGNPGAAGSYGDKLSNSQYSHFNGAHFILVDGRKGDNYIINDPLSRTGSREITASQMRAYMQGLGGQGSGVALSQ